MSTQFDRTIGLIGQEGLEKLKNSTVMIVGVGGVGGYAVESIVRSGVGKVILIDKDTVDITNLNRQIIADNSNVGKVKVDLFEQRSKLINPNVEIIKYETLLLEDNIEEIFKIKPDFVIDAIDTMSAKVALWDYCAKNDIGFIASLGMAKRLDPSKVVITKLNKTTNDPMARALRNIARKRNVSLDVNVVFSLEAPVTTDPTVLGSMMFVPATAGLLAGSFAIKYLIDRDK